MTTTIRMPFVGCLLFTPPNPRNVLYKALVILAAGLIIYTMNGCASSYESAFRRFGKEVVTTDSATVVVPMTVTIPRDSVVITTKTDTTRVVIEERNKTSWVRLYRDQHQTRVEGGCDSASIAKNAVAKVPKKQAIWGVDPKFEKLTTIWRTIALVLGGLVLLGVGAFIFSRKYSITARNPTISFSRDLLSTSYNEPRAKTE